MSEHRVKDLVGRHDKLNRTVKAMETKAIPWWNNELLGLDIPWQPLDVIGGWIAGFGGVKWRVTADTVVMDGLIGWQDGDEDETAIILPLAARPEVDYQVATGPTAGASIKIIAATGEVQPIGLYGPGEPGISEGGYYASTAAVRYPYIRLQ